MCINPSPFVAAAWGVKVSVKLAPKAGGNRIIGISVDSDGGGILKATVAAAPEKGKANAGLIKMLAKEWKLPRTSLSVAAGAKSRRKTLFIEGDAKDLLAHLNQWAEGII